MRPDHYIEFKGMYMMPAKKAGFSLIELMVALLLSTFLLLGVVEIYITNKQANNLQNGFSQVQENGRMAVEIVSREIRRADFWGCLPDASSDSIDQNLDTGSTNYDASLHEFSTGGVGGANNVSSMSIGAIGVVDGTDTLILKGSQGDNMRIEPPYMNIKAAAIHVNTNSGVQQNDVLLISDCSAGDIFQVTNANPDSGTIDHNTGAAVTITNADGNFKKTYGADARLLVPYSKVYFIGNDPNGQPSLFVNINGTVSELIPGVEDMQVTYGQDTNEDLVVDAWRDASQVGVNMDQVIAIRVVFDVRSYDSVGATGADGRLRKTYTATSNVRNRMI